jgi:large subunit ribosomal protein L9
MKVILQQDIHTLGLKFDVKNVKDGFARNFLLPRGLVKFASKTALTHLVEQKTKEEAGKLRLTEKYQKVADALQTTELEFKMKVGDAGRAFGSVTAAKIRDELKKHKIEIEKEWVELAENIKTTGDTIVKIKFPQGIEGTVKIILKAEIGESDLLDEK